MLPVLRPHFQHAPYRPNSLADGETDTFTIDPTVDGGVVNVRDSGTPGNVLTNVKLNSFTFDDTLLTAITGSNLVQSNTSTKLVVRSDGTVRSAPHNIFIQSQTLATGGWTSGNVTLTNAAGTAPDGTNTAVSLVEAATSAAHQTSSSFSPVVGLTYNFSVYAKSLGSGSTRYLEFGGSGLGGASEDPNFDVTNGTVAMGGTTTVCKSATITSVGSGWYRCSATIVATTTTSPLFALASSNSDHANSAFVGDGSSGLLLWGAQFTQGPYLHPYHATTSAAWYGVPQTYDSTAGAYTIANEAAATNLVVRSDNFSTGWTLSSTTAVYTDLTGGPDNGPFSRLTATGANGTALQAITSGSSSRLTSVWLRRRTGTGNIDLTQDNGGTWTTQAITSSWARYSLSAVTSANPTVGIRVVTSGDVVDVWGFQHETGSAVTSTIQTGSATATRSADALGCATSTFPFSATNGTFVTWVKPYLADGATADRLIAVHDGTTNNNIMLDLVTADSPDSFGVDMTSGAAAQVASGTTKAGSASTSGNKVAMWYKANDTGVLAAAGSEVVDSGCSVPTVTTFNLLNDSVTASRTFSGTLSRFKYVARRMSTDQLQANTN